MRILVLGGRSFYARWFMRVADAAGHQVAALSRPDFDLADPMGCYAPCSAIEDGFGHVINFAAENIVADSWPLAVDYYDANVVGMARLADHLHECGGLRMFLQVSTPEVYGTTGEKLREGAPFNPSTPYAISRAAADWHLALMHKELGLPVAFTRTVNIYGEEQPDHRIIPKVARCALRGERFPLEGGGASTRSFIHAEDAARACLAVLERGRPGETYHVAHPTTVSIRFLARTVCEMLGRRPEDVLEDAPERIGKDMNYHLDDSKIRREIGWRETIELPDGLARTLAWAKEAFR